MNNTEENKPKKEPPKKTILEIVLMPIVVALLGSGIKEKEALDHLVHIEKTAHHRGFMWNQPPVNNAVFLSRKGLA